MKHGSRGVTPTLNLGDNTGDTRATVLIIDATRVADVRVYDDEINPTVTAEVWNGRWKCASNFNSRQHDWSL
jgi:hypothetical protein